MTVKSMLVRPFRTVVSAVPENAENMILRNDQPARMNQTVACDSRNVIRAAPAVLTKDGGAGAAGGRSRQVPSHHEYRTG
jgi:hypothetical protein